MTFTVSLALRQLAHRSGRWVLLGLGIALVVAVPVTSHGLANSVAAKGARHTIAGFSTAQRMVVVNQDTEVALGTPAQQDARVTAALATLSSTPARREMGFRQLEVRGQSFMLAATDHLASTVRVTSGRLPSTCSPTHCEVVVLGNADTPALRVALGDLGLSVVGSVARTDPTLVAGPYDPGSTPLVLGDGVDAMTALQSLSLFGRHTDWVTRIDPHRVVSLGVAAYLQRSTDVQNELARTVGGTTLQQQTATLADAASRAATSTRRFGLLGGIAAALLLGFTVVAAAGLRREWSLLVSTLRRRGATPAQVGVITTLAAVLVAVLAAVFGSLIAAVIAASLARNSGLAAGRVAGEALDASAWSVAGLAAAAVVVTVAVLLCPDGRARSVWQVLDVLAVASLAATILAVGRGSTSLGSNGDPLVAVLPVLAAFVAAVLAARLWSPAARLAARLLPPRSVAGRIGLLGAVRRPLRPAATVALLSAAITCVVFAGGYRETLRSGAANSAAFQVPLDVTLASSAQQPVPATVVDPAAISRAAPGTRSFPIRRTAASVQTLPGASTSVPVIGVPSDALPLVNEWRATSGSALPATDLAHRLRATPAPRPQPIIPAGTSAVRIPQTGGSGNLSVRLVVRTEAGREIGVDLVQRGGSYAAKIPAGLGPLHVVAISVAESFGYITHHMHAVGEGPADVQQLKGTLTLGTPSVVGTSSPAGWTWTTWGSASKGSASNGSASNGSASNGAPGSGVTATAGQLRVDYQLNGAALVITPDYASVAARTLRVAVDPATAKAAKDGQLTLSLDGGPTRTAQVVAVLPRLAGAGDTFVLLDLDALTSALDLASPGQSPQEFWLAAPSSSLPALGRLLREDPYASLTVSRRAVIQHNLDTDPVAQGSQTLLSVVALLALGVAALALVLLVVGERRDGAGELYAWESDGIAPRLLRRMLAVRAAAVAVVAVPVGCIAGVLLTHTGVTVVAVDASGASPVPPLHAAIGLLRVLVELATGVGAGVVLAWLIAAALLRERFPVAAEAELR